MPGPHNVEIEQQKRSFEFRITKVADEDEHLVEGEVYAPYTIDTHGDMMLPQDVKLLAYRFLMAGKQAAIDIMHNNKSIQASAVESFIARPNDPDYKEGAWVMTTKIFDDDVWALVKQGVYSGYSFEAYVSIAKAEVTFDMFPQHFGYTEKNDGHEHVFFVEVDEFGKVIGGFTSEIDGHSHVIQAATATNEAGGHSHRYFLQDVEE